MKKIPEFLKCVLALFLSFFVSACSTETGIQKILGRSASAPLFLDCKPVSETELVFNFSLPVRVISFYLDPAAEVASIEEGAEVRISLAEPFGIGEKVMADILVEDESGNTLNVIIPFRSRNNRLPDLVINEVRTEYSRPRSEFVEFLALSSGNLGALRLFIAGSSLVKPVYEFPSVEVTAGEYIVLHLRTLDEGCVDELGTDLSLSRGFDAHDSARDLWIAGSSKLLHKTDAVYLMDQDDIIVSAVLLSETQDPWWNKQYMAAAAELFGRQSAWLPVEGEQGTDYVPVPSDAVSTAPVKTAATRSVSRDESGTGSNSAVYWYVTATSSATPGLPNSTKRQE